MSVTKVFLENNIICLHSIYFKFYFKDKLVDMIKIYPNTKKTRAHICYCINSNS